MARRQRNPEETRQKLLEAAGALLAEAGLYGFHVHDIARRAGFGKPLVYRYFGDRGQVLNALCLAKAVEIEKKLEKAGPGPGTLSPDTYRQVLFARMLAADPVLRGLFKAQLAGELPIEASRRLNDIIPHSGESGDAGAAEAFLLAGISYILLLRDSLKDCNGIPIETPNQLAAFERAFVDLAQKT